MLETASYSTEQYYNRCLVEEINRGRAEPKDEESAEIARQVATEFGGKQHEDFVLEDKLVSEASPEKLKWATQLSRRRLGFLHWTMLAMKRGAPPEPSYKFQP